MPEEVFGYAKWLRNRELHVRDFLLRSSDRASRPRPFAGSLGAAACITLCIASTTRFPVPLAQWKTRGPSDDITSPAVLRPFLRGFFFPRTLLRLPLFVRGSLARTMSEKKQSPYGSSEDFATCVTSSFLLDLHDADQYTHSVVHTDEEHAIEAQRRFDEADAANVPGRKQIGLVSAIFIIFNRIIGTGCVLRFSCLNVSLTSRSCSIFSTPSTILSLSGSVGLAL